MSGGFADPYLYSGTTVLRNRLGLRSADALDRAERNLVRLRYREGVPQGDFDLAHLRAIHRHLFQDVYEWAGELRTVELIKGMTAFMPCRYISSGLADVHRRIVSLRFLGGFDRERFAQEAGRIIGDVNHVHPFREGNGRAQALYLKQLAEQAGHHLDLTAIDGAAWIEASISANGADYEPMGRVILVALAQAE